jgi:hypothetical protein
MSGFEQHCAPKSTEAVKEVSHESPSMVQTRLLGYRDWRRGDRDPRLCLGGWVLDSTAERMAKARADEAVTAILVPICVERFMGQADAAAKLTEFQKTASWQQSQLIEKGGWATMAGNKDPNMAVARMCVQQLVNRKT